MPFTKNIVHVTVEIITITSVDHQSYTNISYILFFLLVSLISPPSSPFLFYDFPLSCTMMNTVRKPGRKLGQYPVAVHREPRIEFTPANEFPELLDQSILQPQSAELPRQIEPSSAAILSTVQALRESHEERDCSRDGEPRTAAGHKFRGPGKIVRLDVEREHLEFATVVPGFQKRGSETDYQGDDGEKGGGTETKADTTREKETLYRVQ